MGAEKAKLQEMVDRIKKDQEAKEKAAREATKKLNGAAREQRRYTLKEFLAMRQLPIPFHGRYLPGINSEGLSRPGDDSALRTVGIPALQ